MVEFSRGACIILPRNSRTPSYVSTHCNTASSSPLYNFTTAHLHVSRQRGCSVINDLELITAIEVLFMATDHQLSETQR